MGLSSLQSSGGAGGGGGGILRKKRKKKAAPYYAKYRLAFCRSLVRPPACSQLFGKTGAISCLARQEPCPVCTTRTVLVWVSLAHSLTLTRAASIHQQLVAGKGVVQS